MTKLQKAANITIHECLRIKKHEQVVIVTDEPCREVAYAIWNEARKITDPIIVEISPRRIHGEEPPPLVTSLLKNCDVFIMPTSFSLTHTKARIEANKRGARGATLPGITRKVMERALNADYRSIARVTKKIVSLLSNAKNVTIETSGAQLALNITGRKGCIDTGIIKQRSEFSNLPGGEAYIAPVEQRSTGTIIIDGSFAPMGFLSMPTTLTIDKGCIAGIEGNRQLKDIFKKYGKTERTLCELGIGTNPKARITGNVLEDEKVLGSVHIAFGNNLGFGGKNKARIHLDGVIKKPSMWIDGESIIKKGQYLY